MLKKPLSTVIRHFFGFFVYMGTSSLTSVNNLIKTARLDDDKG